MARSADIVRLKKSPVQYAQRADGENLSILRGFRELPKNQWRRLGRGERSYLAKNAWAPGGKRWIMENGEPTKKSAPDCHRYVVRTEGVTTLDDLADILDGLTIHEAISLGVPIEYDTAVLVPRRSGDVSLPRYAARTKGQGIAWAPKGRPGILMLDIDKPDYIATSELPIDPDEWTPDLVIAKLTEVFPALANQRWYFRPSSSSFVYDTLEGTWVSDLDGFRLYTLIDDASQIERVGKSLFWGLYGAGYGYVMTTGAGSVGHRSFIDRAVFSPERLDYACAPVCEDGLEWSGDKAADFIGGKNEVLRSEDIPTIDEKDENVRKAKKVNAGDPDFEERRAETYEKWLDARADDHAASVGRQLTDDERAQVRKEFARALQRDQLLGPHIVEVFDYDGVICRALELEADQEGIVRVSVADILANAKVFHNAQTRDPIEPDYQGGSQKGIIWVTEGDDEARVSLTSQAHLLKTYELKVSDEYADVREALLSEEVQRLCFLLKPVKMQPVERRVRSNKTESKSEEGTEVGEKSASADAPHEFVTSLSLTDRRVRMKSNAYQDKAVEKAAKMRNHRYHQRYMEQHPDTLLLDDQFIDECDTGPILVKVVAKMDGEKMKYSYVDQYQPFTLTSVGVHDGVPYYEIAYLALRPGPRGKAQSFVMKIEVKPSTLLGSDGRSFLADHQFVLGEEFQTRQLVPILQHAAKHARTRCLFRFPGQQEFELEDGTSMTAFVSHTGHLYGADDADGALVKASQQPGFKTEGSLEVWKKVLSYVHTQGMPHVDLGPLLGIAAPVMGFIDHANFTVELVGASSSGKSSAMVLASSCWGKPNFQQPAAGPTVQTCNMTANALTHYMKLFSEHGVHFDELSQAADDVKRTFIQTVFNVSGGEERGRLTQASDAKEIESFRNLVTISTEKTIAMMSEEAGRRGGLPQGYEARKLTVVVDRKQMTDFYGRVADPLASNFGHAGHLLLEALYAGSAHDRKNRRLRMIEAHKEIVDQLVEPVAHIKEVTTIDRRVASNCAVLILAADFAQQYAILPEEIDYFDIISGFYMANYSDEGGNEALLKSPGELAVEKFVRFVEMKGYERFWDRGTDSPDAEKVQRGLRGDAWGYRDQDFIYLFSNCIEQVLRGSVCDAQAFVKALKAVDVLVPKGSNLHHTYLKYHSNPNGAKHLKLAIKTKWNVDGHDSENDPDAPKGEDVTRTYEKAGRRDE